MIFPFSSEPLCVGFLCNYSIFQIILKSCVVLSPSDSVFKGGIGVGCGGVASNTLFFYATSQWF